MCFLCSENFPHYGLRLSLLLIWGSSLFTCSEGIFLVTCPPVSDVIVSNPYQIFGTFFVMGTSLSCAFGPRTLSRMELNSLKSYHWGWSRLIRIWGCLLLSTLVLLSEVDVLMMKLIYGGALMAVSMFSTTMSSIYSGLLEAVSLFLCSSPSFYTSWFLCNHFGTLAVRRLSFPFNVVFLAGQAEVSLTASSLLQRRICARPKNGGDS